MNTACPFCHGQPPSTDGRTECGWCRADHTPDVIPSEDNHAPSVWRNPWKGQ